MRLMKTKQPRIYTTNKTKSIIDATAREKHQGDLMKTPFSIHNGIQELEIGASMGLYVDTPNMDKPTFIKK